MPVDQKVVDSSRLSARTYSEWDNQTHSIDINGWTKNGDSSSSVAGFYGQAYKKDTQVVVAYRGTDQWRDWLTNALSVGLRKSNRVSR